MKEFIPQSPDPFLNSGEDMAPAKFGHLNEIVKEINAGGGGGVSGVTASAPCVSTGGTKPNISMPAASSTVDGYCSAADFAIFNGKQDQILLTATATLTAANIIAGAGITILPAPAATKYYVLHSVAMKFKAGSVAFDQSTTYSFNMNKGGIDKSGMGVQGPTSTVVIPTNTTNQFVLWASGIMLPGNALTTAKVSGTDPTVGDSEVVFDVTYELRDF